MRNEYSTASLKCIEVALATGLLLAGISGAHAGDLFAEDVRSALRTETFSAEATAGYLTGNSTEYVYNSDRSRLSQLKWDISNAAVVGGRLAWRPLDWLTVRVRGWASVDANSTMRDYDWLAGFSGQKSYSDISVSPDTVNPQVWSGDVSLAAAFWQDENISLAALAGYRHYEAKFEARGGSYLYSTYAFRDTVGSFPAGQPGITYRQSWDAPYLGMSAAYASGDWTLTGEIVGSPIVQGNADDEHHLRDLNIKSKFGLSTMIGLAGGVEYRMTEYLSLVGRAEYQRFSEARGSARYVDSASGTTFYNPKPGSGADAETATLSLGVKMRL